MPDVITVKLKNQAKMIVLAEPGIAKEILEYFSYFHPNHKHMPKFKNKMWDGKIRLYSLVTYELGVGLYPKLCKFAKDRNYQIKIEDSEYGPPAIKNNITKQDVLDFAETLALPYSLREEQLEAIHTSLVWNRRTLLSPTSSGKSLIIYVLTRWYLKYQPKGKVLIIAPTIGLVTQMLKDFGDYGYDMDLVHTIYEGQSHETDKRVIISTWQSIYKHPSRWFDKFMAVIGDECHGFRADCLNSIMNKSHKAMYRVGLTGTLDGTHIHKLQTEAVFGPVVLIAKTKDLMEEGKVSELNINCIHLVYPNNIRKGFKKRYADEIDFLISYGPRNQFITDLASRLEGNTLVLFRFVEKHGQPLYEKMLKECKNKQVFYVHGGTDIDDRERIRQIVSTMDNALINASVGVFSTGINIPDMHNLIMANPMKGQIKVLQSIGRILRLSYRTSRLYDIVDDVRDGSRTNYALKHGAGRVSIYEKEGFNYKINTIELEKLYEC